MDLRRELNRKIERKRAEIDAWEKERNERDSLIREGLAYISALSETIKLLPKETPSATAAMVLRAGSEVARAREAILKAGKPLHIDEILKALGKQVNHNSKASLSGSIATYVRKHVVFTRPAPNTFGLNELEQEVVLDDEPPPNFGSMNGGGAKTAKET